MRILISIIAFSVFAGCGSTPKGTQLVELERLLQDPSASEVRKAPGAASPYKEAREYRQRALELWEDGDQEESEEYALLGWLKYRTAAAISEQNEARQRLEVANGKVAKLNPEIDAANGEQVKLTRDIAALEKRVALLKSQASRIAFARENRSASIEEYRAKLEETRAAKRAAASVNAEKHAPQTWTRANNQLKSVESIIGGTGDTLPGLIRDLDTALILFNKARKESAEGFANDASKADPAKRRQELADRLTREIGGEVVLDSTTVRLTLPGGFSAGVAAPNEAAVVNIKKLAAALKTYDEFSVRVEGYTSRGDATENLGLSQLRARAAADLLTTDGVASSRISQDGKGQDSQRFVGTENDRVEFVLFQ